MKHVIIWARTFRSPDRSPMPTTMIPYRAGRLLRFGWNSPEEMDPSIFAQWAGTSDGSIVTGHLPLNWARRPHWPDRDRFCGATKNRKVPAMFTLAASAASLGRWL